MPWNSSLSQIGVWFKALKGRDCWMNSQSNVGNLYERRRSLFARNYWVLFSHAWGNPKSWETTRRWRNGKEPGKNQTITQTKYILIRVCDPLVSFGTKSFRITWCSFWWDVCITGQIIPAKDESTPWLKDGENRAFIHRLQSLTGRGITLGR